MDNRDVSIYTQVAFKEAMSRLPAAADLTDESTLAQIAMETAALYDVLADVIGQNQKANVASGQAAAIAAVNQAFPNSEVVGGSPTAADGTVGAAHTADQGGFAVEVANPQQQAGPLPDWLIRACQDKGVTKVWDNRATVASDPSKARQPHFREFVPKEAAQAGRQAQGFWPPKAA